MAPNLEGTSRSNNKQGRGRDRRPRPLSRRDDTLAVAARNGRIYRNLQGYTTDKADALISLGLPPSAAGLWAERARHRMRRLVRAAKSRWKIEQDYLQLKDELGLDHYEGRNWAGWHHHVSMVMMAHAFLTLESLRTKKNFWVDPATDAT